MIYIEDIKKTIKLDLEDKFISSIDMVKKEMNLLNVAISVFEESSLFSYDEYCKKRMEFEVEACDHIDIDFNSELKITEKDKFLINRRVASRFISEEEYEETLRDEYIKLQLNKLYDIDYKFFYKLSKYSSLKLIEYKVSEETWKNKKVFFEQLSEKKAKNLAKLIATSNQEVHEQNIRAKMM